RSPELADTTADDVRLWPESAAAATEAGRARGSSAEAASAAAAKSSLRDLAAHAATQHPREPSPRTGAYFRGELVGAIAEELFDLGIVRWVTLEIRRLDPHAVRHLQRPTLPPGVTEVDRAVETRAGTRD